MVSQRCRWGRGVGKLGWLQAVLGAEQSTTQTTASDELGFFLCVFFNPGENTGIELVKCPTSELPGWGLRL